MLRKEREGGDRRDEQLDNEMEDEQERGVLLYGVFWENGETVGAL